MFSEPKKYLKETLFPLPQIYVFVNCSIWFFLSLYIEKVTVNMSSASLFRVKEIETLRLKQSLFSSGVIAQSMPLKTSPQVSFEE